MNKKVLIGIFCFSCIVFSIGTIMTLSINNLSCDEGYTLKDQKCHKYEYVPYLSSTCKTGYVLHEGKCVKYLKYSEFNKYATCNVENDGSVELNYKDGKCIYRNVYHGTITYSCDKGYTLNNNNLCYKKTTIDATRDEAYNFVCPAGYENEGSLCHRTDYRDPSKTTVCENSEDELKDDYCYGNTIEEEIRACIIGEVLIDDKCYALSEETTSSTNICPFGYSESDNQCVKEYIKEPNKKH